MTAQGKRSRLGQIINTLASGHVIPLGTRRNIIQNGGNRGSDRGDDDDASSQGSASSFSERKVPLIQSSQQSAFLWLYFWARHQYLCHQRDCQ